MHPFEQKIKLSAKILSLKQAKRQENCYVFVCVCTCAKCTYHHHHHLAMEKVDIVVDGHMTPPYITLRLHSTLYQKSCARHRIYGRKTSHNHILYVRNIRANNMWFLFKLQIYITVCVFVRGIHLGNSSIHGRAYCRRKSRQALIFVSKLSTCFTVMFIIYIHSATHVNISYIYDAQLCPLFGCIDNGYKKRNLKLSAQLCTL